LLGRPGNQHPPTHTYLCWVHLEWPSVDPGKSIGPGAHPVPYRETHSSSRPPPPYIAAKMVEALRSTSRAWLFAISMICQVCAAVRGVVTNDSPMYCPLVERACGNRTHASRSRHRSGVDNGRERKKEKAGCDFFLTNDQQAAHKSSSSYFQNVMFCPGRADAGSDLRRSWSPENILRNTVRTSIQASN
jgi:hypothetical protein